MILENEFVFWWIVIISSFAALGGLGAIFFPNYHLKKYISGEIKPHDNLRRLGGLIMIFVYGYILLIFFEVLK